MALCFTNFLSIILIYEIIQTFIVLGMCSEENEIISTLPWKDFDSESVATTSGILNTSDTLAENKLDVIFKQIGFKNASNINVENSLFPKNTTSFENILKGTQFDTIPGLRADDDFENWTPPLEIQRDAPLYLAGFSYNNEPIWVQEYGRWRFDKYLHGSWKVRALYEKYLRYLAYVAIKSEAIKNPSENGNSHTHIILYDFEGLRLDILLDPKFLPYIRKLAREYRRHFETHVSKLIILNVNPLSEVLINLVRPFFSKIMERIEIYGTNKSLWTKQLLKTFPPNQLPEWYGGNNGFKPLFVVG